MNLRRHPILSTWQWFWLASVVLLLVGCNPQPAFTVTPTPLVAGVEASFDASSTVIANTHKGNAAVSYSWAFGDGSTGSGKQVKHTYAQPGTYTVTLTVVDKAGRSGTYRAPVVVAPPASGSTLFVQVQGADGVLINAAQLSIGNATTQSDGLGVARFLGIPAGANQVLRVSKAGYVGQAVRTTLVAGNSQSLLVTLRPLNDPIAVAQIQQAQTLRSASLGASVTLPANALVTPDNQIATGPVTLFLTPWNIQGNDLNAMLGNGRGRDAQGNLVDLISAGMLTVDFFDAQGRKLQLSNSASADIQMDLPVDSINNTTLVVGATIPLWNFDEAQGLWIEEGQGVVVASSTSPVGLAVKGTVRHFSTWNWDFKFDNPGSLTVSCVDTALATCTVVAQVTLDDGSVFTKTATLNAEVTTIVNMPTSGSIRWTATTAGGQIGTALSGTSGNVVIPLSPPKTSNTVRCTLADGTPVDCTVDLIAPLAGGASESLRSFVPAGGALVRSGINTAGPLQWRASSRLALNASGNVVRYEGSATSGLSGEVTIVLNTEVAASGRRVFFVCAAQTVIRGTVQALSACTVNVRLFSATEQTVATFTLTGAPGTPQSVVLPLAPGGFLSINASGTAATGEFVQGFRSVDFDELSPDEVITIETTENVPT